MQYQNLNQLQFQRNIVRKYYETILNSLFFVLEAKMEFGLFDEISWAAIVALYHLYSFDICKKETQFYYFLLL